MLFLIEESKEAAGEKEEASYIGDNVKKHDSRRSEPYSMTKRLFYRDTGAAKAYLYRNEIRREDKSRSGGRTQMRSSGQEGRGAADRRGYLQRRRAVLFAVFSGCGIFLH